MPDTFQMTVTPAKLIAHAGETKSIAVYNNGTRTLHFTSDAHDIQQVGNKCVVQPGTLPWAQVTPHTFTLLPAHRRIINIKIAPTAPAGQHDVGIESSAPTHGHGQFHFNAAITAVMLVKVPGHAASAGSPCVSVPQQAPGSSLVAYGIWAGVALLAAVVILTAWISRPHRGVRRMR